MLLLDELNVHAQHELKKLSITPDQIILHHFSSLSENNRKIKYQSENINFDSFYRFYDDFDY